MTGPRLQFQVQVFSQSHFFSLLLPILTDTEQKANPSLCSATLVFCSTPWEGSTLVRWCIKLKFDAAALFKPETERIAAVYLMQGGQSRHAWPALPPLLSRCRRGLGHGSGTRPSTLASDTQLHGADWGQLPDGTRQRTRIQGAGRRHLQHGAAAEADPRRGTRPSEHRYPGGTRPSEHMYPDATHAYCTAVVQSRCRSEPCRRGAAHSSLLRDGDVD